MYQFQRYSLLPMFTPVLCKISAQMNMLFWECKRPQSHTRPWTCHPIWKSRLIIDVQLELQRHLMMQMPLTTITSQMSHSSRIEDELVDTLDEELVFGTQRMDIGGGGENREADEDVFLYNCDRNVVTPDLVEESVLGVETESFKSTTEEIEFIPDDAISSSHRTQASPSSYTEVNVDQKKEAHGVPSHTEVIAESSFIFAASSYPQGQSSTTRRKNKKKPGINYESSSFELSSSSEEYHCPVIFVF